MLILYELEFFLSQKGSSRRAIQKENNASETDRGKFRKKQGQACTFCFDIDGVIAAMRSRR